MSPDALARLLAGLDQAPVLDQPDLHDTLFDRLVRELERPSWRDRLGLPQVRARVRKAALAAAVVVAIIVAVTAVTWIVDRLRPAPVPVIDTPTEVDAPSEDAMPDDDAGTPTARSTVLDARTRWLSAPPPVHATTVVHRAEPGGSETTTSREIWRSDDGRWRVESSWNGPDGAGSAVSVWDGAALLEVFSGPPSSAQVTTFHETGRYPFDPPLDEWLRSAWAWERRCGEGQVLGDVEIAGRTAAHVRCGVEELWLDAETGLLLRHELPADVDDVDRAAVTFEVTSVAYEPSLDAAVFDTRPPADVTTSTFVQTAPTLRPGDPAPPFDARTVDGAAVTLPDDRPTLIVFWSPGLYDLGGVEQIHRTVADLRVVVYDDLTTGTVDETATYAAARGYTVPIVFDAAARTDDGRARIATAWRGVPPETPGSFDIAQFWALVRPDGTVAATRTGMMLPEEAAAWLRSNGVDVAAEPLPQPTPRPETGPR